MKDVHYVTYEDLRGAEPDGIGTDQRASQRVHQDGRSEGAVGNLRGVRYHNVRNRQSADTLYGQLRVRYISAGEASE